MKKIGELRDAKHCPWEQIGYLYLTFMIKAQGYCKRKSWVFIALVKVLFLYIVCMIYWVQVPTQLYFLFSYFKDVYSMKTFACF